VKSESKAGKREPQENQENQTVAFLKSEDDFERREEDESLRQQIYELLHELLNKKKIELEPDLVKTLAQDKQQEVNQPAIAPVVGAVQVKLLEIDYSNTIVDPNDSERPKFLVQTFKVTPSSNFGQLKEAACDFWGLIEQHFGLFAESSNEDNKVI
jgi:hypothetical protein